MIRVERLVTPEAKSFCSTSRVRLPARAHSRASATPFMPPPMITTWKCCPSKGGRGLVVKLMYLNQMQECRKSSPEVRIPRADTSTSAYCAPIWDEHEGNVSPNGAWPVPALHRTVVPKVTSVFQNSSRPGTCSPGRGE